ncbi:MAG: class I tRNA ligase family protein, partial [Coriobacteriia bacterium]|nr:class I tRNA ligase family protein [Coriobacteriia bacterium]
ADIYARFLRDRIGAANVLFISGTDCYGSPIDEGYRKLVAEGGFQGSIEDYVRQNHDAQKASLAAYDISLDIYEGSGLGRSKAYHKAFTDEVFKRLLEHDGLLWLSTAQFYDEEVGSYLNGRQVEGRCPWPNCDSENAYADECSLGHSYQPEELIDPISTLSGQPPVLREAANWYLDIVGYRQLLEGYIAALREGGSTRKVVTDTMEEFLLPPTLFVKNDFLEAYQQLAASLPGHGFKPAKDQTASFELAFADLDDRDKARDILDKASVRYRSGKTLVPFRLTGNIAWGVQAPDLGKGDDDLTVWCWPESLWAPISFTQAYLGSLVEGLEVESLNPSRPASPHLGWQDFWCDPEARVYQFIGQDNIYFYGVAQTPLFSAFNNGSRLATSSAPGDLQQTQLVANYHLLYFGRKASSSSALKPPMADDLLDLYAAEQLRAHFVALGLSLKPASFRPKPLNPKAQPNDADPVLKDGQVLTNVLNRLARSCFYTAQSEQSGRMPLGEVSLQIQDMATDAVLAYEQAMFRQELHVANQIAADFTRKANKYWSDQSKAAQADSERRQLLVDCFYLLRVGLLLWHPIAPRGTRLVWEYLELDGDGSDEAGFFSWDHVDESGLPGGFERFVSESDREAGAHAIRELPPRTDFFTRHPSQFS